MSADRMSELRDRLHGNRIEGIYCHLRTTRPSIPTGSLMMEDTRTRPVSKQTTIVSQNTPDMEIRACLEGVSCSCTCVNDRSRTQTGFICEQTTRYAGTDTCYYCCTNKTAACCRVECALYDCCESCGNIMHHLRYRLRYNLQCTDQPLWESASHIP